MVVHRFRLADVFGAADWLQLSARVKRLANSISFLPEHRLFVGDDFLPAVVELDDGVWRVGLEQRRQGEGEEMDPGDDRLRRRVYRAPLDRVATPDARRTAAVLPAGTLGQAFTTTEGVPPSPLFGATFFTITGLHMFHVATGAIYLAVVAARINKLKHEDVEISGLYWHFVDLVWMFVFPLIYIMSVDVGGHLAASLSHRRRIEMTAATHTLKNILPAVTSCSSRSGFGWWC